MWTMAFTATTDSDASGAKTRSVGYPNCRSPNPPRLVPSPHRGLHVATGIDRFRPIADIRDCPGSPPEADVRTDCGINSLGCEYAEIIFR